MNRVELVGRLTKDPEMRTTTSGTAVTRFTLAVSRNFVNKNGEKEADFINCSAWGRQAANVAKYCHKGSLVSAEGRIRTSSYDAQDGTKRYVTEVVCDFVNFLTPKSGSDVVVTDNVENENPDNTVNEGNAETADLTDDPFKNFGEEITLSSDDLPF